jgi:hypothetical protein
MRGDVQENTQVVTDRSRGGGSFGIEACPKCTTLQQLASHGSCGFIFFSFLFEEKVAAYIYF